MASELLQTKLAVPPLRAALVARRALFARLDEGMLRRLTLVSAPAGYGKTTLVASWLAQKREAVGWISLDKGDNDPARFLLYLLAALRDACPTLQGPAPTLFHAPHPPPPEQVLTTLINEFERQFDGPAGSNRCVLVLDDYHVIANEALHAAIAFLLVHLPQALSVIIITRADPPLPLARLRAQGQLLELRQADLRFTLEETGDFLHDVMRLALDAEETTLLANRTESWIAGLQLAALSLRRCEDSAQFVRMFGGSHRFVLDYLLEEVLQGQE
ncbi:MAG: AAA family ATPase, partial [Chloroflexota bacterium]